MMMLRLTQRSVSAASKRVLAVPSTRTVAAIVPALSHGTRCLLHSSTVAASASSGATATPAHADAAAEQPLTLAQMERPRPVSQFKRKPARDPSRFDLPPPARPTTEAEFEALKLKGYDGNVYDRMACYQLGQLFFDGVPAPKSADAKPAVAAAAAPASVTADSSADVAAEFVSGPWSLPKNYTQSLLWFTNAAFEGHVPSRTKLGVMYLAGYGIKRNMDIALQLFTESSEEGDRDAQAHLAAMHLQGVGTPKNLAKAVDLYTNAAERGHVRAQSALAKLLDSPDSGELHNRSKALHWLSEAARASHTESQYLLAQKLEAGSSPDPVAVFAWYTKAAQGGHAQAQYIVGLAHARDAVPTASGAATAATATSLTDRLAAAARWFSLSSEQGNVSAQARLGFMSYHGVGTARDEGAGLMWLSNAAEANQLDAQLLLGSIAFDEHERQQRDAPPAPGSKEEGKKLQTAKAYFDKVLENANKHCTTLPSGSLPLLVRMAQDPSMPSRCLQQYQQQTGQPWLGDLNVLLRHLLDNKA